MVVKMLIRGFFLQREEVIAVISRLDTQSLCLKILTKILLLLIRVDINFETFADVFAILENSSEFLPNQGAKKPN